MQSVYNELLHCDYPEFIFLLHAIATEAPIRVLMSGGNSVGYRCKQGTGKAIADSLIQHGAKKAYAGIRPLNAVQSLVKAYVYKVIPIHIDNDMTANRGQLAHLAHVNAHVQFPHRLHHEHQPLREQNASACLQAGGCHPQRPGHFLLRLL